MRQYRELTYGQPHSLHIPTDTETNHTKDKVDEQEVQIEALSAKIGYLRADFDAESQEKLAELRPIMGYLHDQICIIQKQIEDAWNPFSAEAQAVVTAKATDLEGQAPFLKEENSKTPRFLALIRLFPARRLAAIITLELAAMKKKRWRNLTVNDFLSKLDIDAHLAPEKPAVGYNGPMDELESFKIKGICEGSVVFKQPLDVVWSSSHDKPTDMELTSPKAIYHLAQPQFASIFRSLVILKVDVCEMRIEVDLLTQFQQVETLEAYGLRLPTHTLQAYLPIIHTLKRMEIKSVSVRWMAGRAFPNMEDCTIAWPHYPETLALGGGVDLPVCTLCTATTSSIRSLTSVSPNSMRSSSGTKRGTSREGAPSSRSFGTGPPARRLR